MTSEAVWYVFYTAQPHTNTGKAHVVDAMVKWMFELWRQTCQELCWLCLVLFSSY